MISNKIKLLAVGIVLLGATSYAFACGENKQASETKASYSSAEKAGAGCCASKGTKASAASAAKVASNGCASHKGTVASAAGSDHCATGAKSAKVAAGECSYGENTVTMAGACPTKNEADYAFYVAGAECSGTGRAVAEAVKAVKGVAAVTVDYDKQMVYICADAKAASKQSIAKSLKTAGYDEVKFVSMTKQNCSKSHGKV